MSGAKSCCNYTIMSYSSDSTIVYFRLASVESDVSSVQFYLYYGFQHSFIPAVKHFYGSYSSAEKEEKLAVLKAMTVSECSLHRGRKYLPRLVPMVCVFLLAGVRETTVSAYPGFTLLESLSRNVGKSSS